MNLLNFFKREKNATGDKAYLLTYGNYIHTKKYNDIKLAHEGYIQNGIVYKCISLIAEQVALMNIGLGVFNENNKIEKEIKNHDILKLINKPYPTLSRSKFLNRIASQERIYGNYYIEKRYNPRDGKIQVVPPIGLYPLRPDQMDYDEGKNSIVRQYRYNSERDGSIVYPVSDMGKSNIIHGMTYNPVSDYIGLSPLVPVGYSIDLHNEIGKQDLGFMQNGARPSGILTIPEGVNMDEPQINLLKKQLDEKYSGSENKGRPMVLNNGVTWQQISLSHTDSEATEVKKMAAQEIGNAFKVPMELLNIIPAKFDNLDLAYEQLYYDAVIPLGNDIVQELNDGLLPLYKNTGDMKLYADFSHTKVMQNSRIRVMEKINPISFMSNNEKREMVNLEQLDGEDELKQPMKMTPEKNEYISEQMANGNTYQESLELANKIYG